MPKTFNTIPTIPGLHLHHPHTIQHMNPTIPKTFSTIPTIPSQNLHDPYTIPHMNPTILETFAIHRLLL